MKPDDVFDELRSALSEADAVPDDVLQAAKDSFTWRTVDVELAELAFDSAIDELAGVRAASAADRQLTFRADDVELEIMVDGRRISGQLVPTQAATIELVAGGAISHADVDDLGSFFFDDVAPGPIRLTIQAGEQTIATEWTIV